MDPMVLPVKHGSIFSGDSLRIVFCFWRTALIRKKNSSTTNTSMEILTNGYWNVVKQISCKLMIFWSISLYSSKIVWLHSSQKWRCLRTSLPSFTFQSLFSTQGQPMCDLSRPYQAEQVVQLERFEPSDHILVTIDWLLAPRKCFVELL